LRRAQRQPAQNQKRVRWSSAKGPPHCPRRSKRSSMHARIVGAWEPSGHAGSARSAFPARARARSRRL